MRLCYFIVIVGVLDSDHKSELCDQRCFLNDPTVLSNGSETCVDVWLVDVPVLVTDNLWLDIDGVSRPDETSKSSNYIPHLWTLNFLSSCNEQLQNFGDISRVVIVELICLGNLTCFIRCNHNLINTSIPSVRYEAAGTLITLSTASTAVKAAASCYIKLVVKKIDNNVKLVVLDRLMDSPQHEKILREMVWISDSILRVLSSPDLEMRRKTLNLATKLITTNIEEIVLVLKEDVSSFTREAETKFDNLRSVILEKFLGSFSSISMDPWRILYKSTDIQEHLPLRKYLMDGDFFTEAAMATPLPSLALHYSQAQKHSTAEDSAQ